MVAARLLTARAFAHRIVSLREQRRPAGGIRGGEPGGEIDADAENAAKTDERRVHGDVNERGAVVERERDRERETRARDWDRWWVRFSPTTTTTFGFRFFSLLSSRVKYSVQKKSTTTKYLLRTKSTYFRFRVLCSSLSPPLSLSFPNPAPAARFLSLF